MPAATFSFVVSTGCLNGAGFLRITRVFGAPADATGIVYVVTGDARGEVAGSSFLLSDLPVEVSGLLDDRYTVALESFGGASSETVSKTVDIGCTGSGTSAPGRISLNNVRPSAPTTPGATGQFLVDITGLLGTARVVVYSFQGPGGAPALVFDQYTAVPVTDFLIPNLATGNYDVAAYNASDFNERSGFIYFVPPYVAAPKGGCTDRGASNFDGAATFDDGTCEYVPRVVPAPVFAVPLLNSTRFVQVAQPDHCATFENLDNTLFCQQRRPGMQLRPLYFQPVCFCDPFPVQVLSNYARVEAVVHRHADGQVLREQELETVLALQGEAPYRPCELASAGDGNTRLIDGSGGLPTSLLAAKRVSLRLDPAGPVLSYQVLRSGRASATVSDDYLLLSRPWDGPVAGSPEVSWPLSGPGFNVWEATLDLSGLPAGDYEVRLHGYDGANRSATAIGEPIRLAEQHENTVVVEYRNTDNAFGMVFTTGITPRLRVPGTFFRAGLGGTVAEHRNSDNTPLTLASTAQRLIALETYGLPAHVHEQLYLITRLDYLRVNGVLGKGSGAYEFNPSRQYPLSAGRVNVEQIGWLGAGNDDDAGDNESGDNLLVLRAGGFLKLSK